ncbi:MAG TPA: PadR family transcriptional regulator, partial [Solirubrobacterales bacterium]|nr:PadR family transcriptional regulator [Solirubrobacterales bacterium]
MSSRSLTSTSYAILCLISIRSWSTYELAQLMKRSMHFVWPRAESNLYAEPKRLVEAGMAMAEVVWNGDRKRTVYSITPEGRRALADWLKEPGGGPTLEFEGLLKVIFADHGNREDALATLARVGAWARERNEQNLGAALAYLAGEGPFQE